MIFFFTATGNSKFITERIAAQTGDQIKDIAECIRTGNYSYNLAEGETVGIIVPVYYYGLPMIVGDFLRKLNVSHKSYSYAVLNCGGTTADSGAQIRRLFPIDAEFGIVTVDNYVPMYKTASDEEKQARLDKAERAIEEIARRVIDRSPGDFNECKGAFPRLITRAVYPLYQYGRKTAKFTVNDSCTGCGLCERICPRQTIKPENGSPVWTVPQCEICLGCLHRCPAAAINYGKKISEKWPLCEPAHSTIREEY